MHEVFIHRLKQIMMGKINSKKGKLNKGSIKRITQLEVKNHYVAGIDVSDKEMMTAYPVNEKERVVQVFGTFTCDLIEIVKCLKKHRITSVAMESTGVYWIPLYLLLEDEGFEVFLVNAKHTKNVTGRKDDESDAEWIQKLHSCGLLSASFQPGSFIRAIRSMVRHRSTLIKNRTSYINRIQKVLEQMNIKLHTIISDIDGVTGLRIIEAILAGERDATVLAGLRHSKIIATEEEIVKSLQGYWKNEHLFELKQCYELYKYHQQMITECENEIKVYLEELVASENGGVIPSFPKKKRKVNSKNKVSFDLSALLNALLGTDLTEVFGLSEISVLQIVSEVGTDMSHWKTPHHFTSWLGLAPNTKKSGGVVISSRIKKKKHYAGQAFRNAANSLINSKSPLGDFYRRIKSKAGSQKAVVASARKLAIIFYNMVKKKEGFNPTLLVEYLNIAKEKKRRYYEKQLAKLNAA